MEKPVYGEIFNALNQAGTVALAGHIHPDADAIGACLALAMACRNAGKKPLVFLEPFNEKFNIIPGSEFIVQDSPENVSADVFFALDCACVQRLGEAASLLSRCAKVICIDHHHEQDPFGTINFIDENASSTCEMVFDFLDAFEMVDVRIAAALYAGMVYDTGGFRHASASPRTHKIAAALVAKGIPAVAIYDAMIRTRALAEAKLLGKSLDNLILDGVIAVVYVTKKDLEQAGAKIHDTDGIADYALNIRGVEVVLFLYPLSDTKTKISLRAKTADVSQAARFFGGGGHKLAAGCCFEGDHTAALTAALPVLKKVLGRK